VTDGEFTDAFYVEGDPHIGLSAMSDLRIVESSDTGD
jgi:hypothetical protein